jgi:5-bromo-4-chloroindolyl phosphate hydrolysis protein
MTTDEEKLRGYIDEVREAIRLDWERLATKPLTADERKAIRKHLEKCHSALKNLQKRIDLLHKNQN